MTGPGRALGPPAPRGVAAPPVVDLHTFLFSDIESSTGRWEAHPESMANDLATHDELLRAAVEAAEGEIFAHTGDGIGAVFGSETAAVAAAVAAQRALATATWSAPVPLRVRMGVHTGPAQRRAANYFGPTLNRAARLMSIGSGGQILCSRAVVDRVDEGLPPGVDLLDLGEHRLADLSRPEHVYEVRYPGLSGEFPPLRSLGRQRHNLPVATDAFLGRARELAELEGLLASNRLLSLLGTGGVGKTRLALQLAAGAIERFPAGVWLVGLAPVHEPDLVGQAVAAALGIDTAGQVTPGAVVDRLARYLTAKRVLLVFDNCEHLLDGAAAVIHDLLTRCPELTVLATSREVLSVPGEVAWRVPVLSLPPATSGDAADLGDSDAVALFVERAAAARPGFALRPGNAAQVARICRRLDGIPLALELAAARIRTLGVHQIAERLDDCFPLLTGGSRTVVSRHATLRATLDWSHDLLTPEEQAGLRRLAVFPAGFALDGAEAVLQAGPDAVDLIVRLVDKSLVVVSDDEEPRYRLLEPVRQYAQERLTEACEEDETNRRHRDFCLALAASLPRFGMFAHERASRVVMEQDSLLAALEWSMSAGDTEEAMLLLRVLSYLWYFDRAHPGAAGWLKRVLAANPDDSPERVHLLWLSAAFESDVPQRLAFLGEAIATAERTGDPESRAAVAFIEGEARLSGSLDDWRKRVLYARELFEGIAHDVGIGLCEDQLGWIAVAEGDYDTASRHFARAAEIGRGLAHMIAPKALSALAPLQVLAGDRALGLQVAAEAERLSLPSPIRVVGVMTRVRAGETALLAGEPEVATRYLADALRIIDELDTEHHLADCLDLVGVLLHARGDVDAAGRVLCDAAALRGRGASGVCFLGAEVTARRAELAGSVGLGTAAARPGAAEAVAYARAALSSCDAGDAVGRPPRSSGPPRRE